MMDPTSLVSDSMFAALPDAATRKPPIQEIADLDGAPLADLVDGTYHALKQDGLSLTDALRLWEIRLTLLLFNGQLAAAKREGCNLSNALYVGENPNAQDRPSPVSSQPSSRVGSGQSVNSQIIAEPTRSQSPSAAAPMLAPGHKPRTPHLMYPMPKNNSGYIHHGLFVLILRLRSAPNLSLVNELYTLCYQSRLREEPSGYESLEARLIRLAYQVIAVLVITKNYPTLLDFITSLQADLQAKINNAEATPDIKLYHSNVSLMYIVANALSAKARGAGPSTLQKLEPAFSQVNETSLQALVYVLNTYSPVLGGEVTITEQQASDVSLEKLLGMVFDDKLSVRIICCTLSVWDLAATTQTDLTTTTMAVKFQDGPTPLDKVYSNIASRWGDYVNKLYAME